MKEEGKGRGKCGRRRKNRRGTVRKEENGNGKRRGKRRLRGRSERGGAGITAKGEQE